MASQEHLDKMQLRQNYRNLWHTDLMGTIQVDTPCTLSLSLSLLYSNMVLILVCFFDANCCLAFWCNDFEIDYESEENAQIVYLALAVDKELQPDKLKRQMTVSNGKLSVHFETVETRFLHASFSAFVDVHTLVTKTIEEFGQGMEL
ncbi:hypothetical protein TEA_011463 [Camellia sinensis var. sinensis]|uniref:Uncharacterized protein n=1 Tax=Camellia sinensis var. sinensis TaxID=542762 RepID=A0A4S4ELP6_CAMSN|nr:hypothetical protein TEA_011463 [Camellia sinensis var. sinensis]